MVSRNRHKVVLAVAVALALVAAACSSGPTPAPLPTSFVIDVPTLPAAGEGCRGIGIVGTLEGDPNDPRVTWLSTADGRRELVWPAGYHARFYRFVANLEILDATGNVVHRQGDSIDGACVAGPAGDPGSILLIPPPGS